MRVPVRIDIQREEFLEARFGRFGAIVLPHQVVAKVEMQPEIRFFSFRYLPGRYLPGERHGARPVGIPEVFEFPEDKLRPGARVLFRPDRPVDIRQRPAGIVHVDGHRRHYRRDGVHPGGMAGVIGGEKPQPLDPRGGVLVPHRGIERIVDVKVVVRRAFGTARANENAAADNRDRRSCW
jgi:hypothetical protein